MDLTQVVLAFTIVIITALLTVLGIEVFYILKDVRKLVDRVNIVMNDAEEIVGHVKKPTEMIASISTSAAMVTKILEAIKPADHPEPKPVVTRTVVLEEGPGVAQEVITPLERQAPQPSVTMGRRFFRMPRRPVS